MRSLKLAFLATMGLLTLAACSATFGAAPDGQYMGSSQQYQDYSQHTQQSPDVSASREHGW